MDTFLQDLRYAGRKLLRAPGFTIIAIATLAIAIGATTAVYSIVDGVLLQPLPFASPDRLVRVASTSREGSDFPISPPDYLDFLYFTVTIGVANQTADIAIRSRPMRILVLIHSVISYFFNATILALSINIVSSLL